MVRAQPHRNLLDDEKGGSTTSPTPFTTRDHGGKAYTSQPNFDTNMVIILGALLCALICALGLNSLIRCALRCTTDTTRPDPARPTRFGVGFRGLKRSTIRQIPIAIYSNDIGDNNFISTDCMVCLGEFEEGEKIRVLPKCKHGFHIRCIDTWLLSHSSCPTCRQLVSEWTENRTDSVGNILSGDNQSQLANESG